MPRNPVAKQCGLSDRQFDLLVNLGARLRMGGEATRSDVGHLVDTLKLDRSTVLERLAYTNAVPAKERPRVLVELFEPDYE